METKLLALKLFFDELGLGTDISNVDQRKAKQKAIYLASACGLDLGYNYGWYVKGPYSPSLTKDYYELQNYQEDEFKGKLTPAVKDILNALNDNWIRSKKRPPGLSDADWLELICSVHFLKHKLNYNDDKINKTIGTQKGHVFPHLSVAIDVLENDSGFLPQTN